MQIQFIVSRHWLLVDTKTYVFQSKIPAGAGFDAGFPCRLVMVSEATGVHTGWLEEMAVEYLPKSSYQKDGRL
jgi:hypothetical protein